LRWYTGFDKKDSTGKVGYAWSLNGINWTKHPEPVMLTGNYNEWDAASIFDIHVFFDGTLFHAWYNAYCDIYPSPLRIGYAISTDGIHWQKHPANPVLDVGAPGSWDDHGVGVHSMNYNGSYYEMWFDGYDIVYNQVGYAKSFDGFNWIKSSENPVLKIGELGSWDTWLARIPVVVSQDSIYRMWYYGHNNARGCIGYATTSVDEAMTWDTATINKPQKVIRVQVFNRIEYINVDSLANILPGLSDNELIDALNKLALAYSLNDSKKSLNYAEKAIGLAKKENYPEGKAMALYSIGNSQYVMDNYSDALANQLSALWLFDSLNMQIEQGNLLSQIAGIHAYIGSHDLASRYYERALNVFESQSDTTFIIHSLMYLGNSNLKFGDTVSAIKVFQRKLSLVKAIGDKWKEAESYEDLGRCYSARKLDSALYYFNEANNIWDERIAPWNQGYNFLITAEAYSYAGPEYYDKAEEYYLKCANRLERHNMIRMKYGRAELYFKTGRYKSTGEFLNISLHDCQNFLSKQDHQMFTYLNDKMEYEKFLKSYMEKIYHLYFQLDTTLNDDRSALKHHLLATQWGDSIYDDQSRNKMDMMQGKFDAEISKTKISILEKENEIKNLTLKKSRIYLFGLGVLVLIISVGAFIYIRQRKIRAQNVIEIERVKSEKLKELDHLKSLFFANISHEFRTPLTLILGPLEKLLSKTNDVTDKKELAIAKKYAGRLQNLINQLLTISKLESGKMQLHTSETDIVKLVRGYLQAYESLATQKNITLKFAADVEEISVYLDKEKFEQVMNNLLSNAFKFTDEGEIIVSVDIWEPAVGSQQFTNNPNLTGDRRLKSEDLFEKWIQITISDTGCGISPEHINHVFDRFYQAEHQDNSHYEGTGIGLALTKELVELHYGIIKVESEQGIGTSFTITLPLGREHLKDEEIIDEKLEETSPVFSKALSEKHDESFIVSDEINESNDKKPILLIVEDNTDMRFYIREFFENEFGIVEAVDGVDGYMKSIEHIPDIIISDVMMPNMDGNAFCNKVKTDERTSHIPVILVTARASKESRIEGLETGADDFITKPFDGEELQVRVKNLIDQRKKLITHYRKDFELSREDTEEQVLTLDEKFLLNAKTIVQKNLSNPDFEVKDFSSEMALSRVQLHRKLRALVDNSVTEFIRIIRLAHAIDLLQRRDRSISEIAYDVGFNNPTYFSSSFRQQYGLSPTEYLKKIDLEN